MIFLDTGYFRGLLDSRDAHHNDSLEIKEFIDNFNETTVINSTVLFETLNRSVGFEDNIKCLYDDLCDDNVVIPLTDEDYLHSLEVNRWFGNTINYNDCTIIHTMMDMGIQRIVSFDNSFKKIQEYEVISSLRCFNEFSL